MKPQISIIVPVYKVETYLRECIESIINQTYKNLEIILVDDGSPDNSGVICDEYAKIDKRIKVIHKGNGGVSSARNAGLEIASGEYIQFVDSDDYINKNMTEALLSEMIKNDTDLVICDFLWVEGKRLVRGTESLKNAKFNSIGEFQKAFSYYYCETNILHTSCNKLYKRELCGRFDPIVSMGEDSIFNFEYLKRCARISIINDTLYNYRYRENSAVNSYWENRLAQLLFSHEKTEEFCRNTFSSEFDISELYLKFCMDISMITQNDCYKAKNALKKIKDDMRNPRVIRIFNELNQKPYNINDKALLFFIKHKMTILFFVLVRLKNALKKTFPKLFNLLKKICRMEA